MRRSLIYIIIWSLYTASLFVVFNFAVDSKTAVIRTSTIVVTQILVFYSNLKWILPRFYEYKKYASYILLNLIIVVLSIVLNSYAERFTPHYIDHARHQLEAQHLINVEVILMYAMPLTLALFLSFFLFVFQKQKSQEEKELAIITAEKQFLVQQINPHFLFNTLNNIYYLTYKTSPKGSETVMQLSKMLDYSLYGEKEGSVSLKDEVAYLENFIALYKLKDSSIENIGFDYTKAELHQKVAPMLLLPFVENAFKHGNIEDVDNGFITIELESKERHIIFNCSNSYSRDKTVDDTRGIGIANVTRRLELLYPGKHELKVDQTATEYSVSLKLTANV